MPVGPVNGLNAGLISHIRYNMFRTQPSVTFSDVTFTMSAVRHSGIDLIIHVEPPRKED